MRVIYFSKGIIKPTSGPHSAARNLLDYISNVTDEIQFFCVSDLPCTNQNTEINIFSYLNPYYNPPEIPLLSFELENYLAKRKIRQICEIVKPDLVHVHGYSGYYPSAPKDFNSLITFHDFPPMMVNDDVSFGPSKFILKLWLKHGQIIRLNKIHDFDHFHALSSEIANYFKSRGIAHSKIHHIPNGYVPIESKVNKEFVRSLIRNKLGLSHNSKILTMVGTISYRKGVHILKKCIQKLPTNYHLILIGKPAKYVGNQYLKSIIGKGSDRIHYIGYQPLNVIKLILQASDCFLSLSFSEACQLSPLEAISSKIPVIITDCGAARDIFGSNYNLLLPISPKVNLLCKKIIEAIENGSKHQNFQSKHHSWEKVAILMKNLYFNIVNND